MASATVHSVMHGVVLCGMVWGCGATCLGAAEREWRLAPLATLPIHPATHASLSGPVRGQQQQQHPYECALEPKPEWWHQTPQLPAG